MRVMRLLRAVVAALVLPGAPAVAADVTVGADVNSAYVWRGLTFSGDPVFQPSLEVGGLVPGGVPLRLNVWGNFNLGDWSGTLQKWQFSEVDFTVTAELPRGFSAGYTEYVFTVGEPSTRELSAAWSRDLAWATPTVTVIYDVEQIDSGFLLLSLERALAWNARASLDLKAEAGYASESFARYYAGEKGGLYQFNVSGRVSWRLGNGGRVSATVGFTNGFDRAVLPRQEARLYGGISAAYGF